MPAPPSLRTRLLAVAFGCAVALVLAEVVLRVHAATRTTGMDPGALRRTAESWPPPWPGRCGEGVRDARHGEIFRPSDVPGLVYALKPGLDTCFYGARVRTNAAGLRAEREYARPKPADTFRVLLLGDSQTFGQGVAFEDTFGQVLERTLRAAHPGVRVEVINAGVDGYNLYQESAWLLAEGLSYEPDVVVVLFIGNDLDLPLFLYTPYDPWAPDRFFVGEVVTNLLGLGRGEARPLVVPTAGYVPEAWAHMAGAEGYETGLRRLGEVTGTHGIPVVNLVDEASARHAFGDPDAEARARALAARLGLHEPPYVYPSGFELSAENAHWNPAGHRRHAEAVARALASLGLLPARAGDASP